RFDVAVRGGNDGLWDWDLTTDTLYCSPRWYAVAGIKDAGDVVPISFWLDRVNPDDVPELRAAVDAHLRGHVDHLACENRLLVDAGVCPWPLVGVRALRRDDGTPYRLAGSLTDTTDRRHAEERRLHEALHDGLTGLANRTLFVDRLSLTIRRRQRTDAH